MRRLSMILFVSLLFLPASALACESCSCALSRTAGEHRLEKGRWFFDTTVEGIDWDSRDAGTAHEMHHQGYDVHNKTHEEFYHFSAGWEAARDLTLFAELPYVVRHLTEVDSHPLAGQKQTSEGLGDMKLTALHRLWRKGEDFIGPLAGIKLPTGSTEEKTPRGTLFEPDMQPGSGSVDWSFGGAFQKAFRPFTLHGNVLYAFKNEGDHDFRYGDLLSSYIYADMPVAPGVWLGADMNVQVEGRHSLDGVESGDSGGTTVIAGPSLKVSLADRASVLANVLLPVFQDLGGVHQEMDFSWNVSARIAW